MSQEELLRIRDKMSKVLNDSYASYDFQMFMGVITHAITCKDCSREFYKSIAIAKHHLSNELK